jgi:hypothetical protein
MTLRTPAKVLRARGSKASLFTYLLAIFIRESNLGLNFLRVRRLGVFEEAANQLSVGPDGYRRLAFFPQYFW